MPSVDEIAQKIKEVYKTKNGKELTDEEAKKGAEDMIQFSKIVVSHSLEIWYRNKKLKQFPKGFHPEDKDMHACPTCDKSVPSEQTWFDSCGFKCMDCQRNLDKKVIPKSVYKNKDSWYSVFHLKYYFGLKHHMIHKLIKEGKLKARILKTEQGEPYEYIFLKKENPELKRD